MKKYFSIIVCLFINIGLFGCGNNDNPIPDNELFVNNQSAVNIYMSAEKPVKFSPMDVSLLFYASNLDALEKESDIIIHAKILPNSVNKIMAYGLIGEPSYGVTLTDVEVIEVFQGGIMKGDIITILEHYFCMETEEEIIVRHITNYAPSEIGQEYIFFLCNDTREGSPYADTPSVSSFDR
ncbi:MAG: hypothetical protein FWG13_08150, partial [Leptospirales bacterium]|nr:hypothetical protein [Leptospirales bacterium]